MQNIAVGNQTTSLALPEHANTPQASPNFQALSLSSLGKSTESRQIIKGAVLLFLIWFIISFGVSWAYVNKKIDDAIRETDHLGQTTMRDVSKIIQRSVKTSQSVLQLVSSGAAVKPLLRDPQITNISTRQSFEVRRRQLEEAFKITEARDVLFNLTSVLDDVEEMWVLNKNGIVIASSNSWRDTNLADGLEGGDFSTRHYFRDAINGSVAKHFVFIQGALHPSFFIAMPVYEGLNVVGVIAMSVLLPPMTPQWLGESIIMLSDQSGLVTYSSDYRYESMMLPQSASADSAVRKIPVKPWETSCLPTFSIFEGLIKTICSINASNALDQELLRFADQTVPFLLVNAAVDDSDVRVNLFLAMKNMVGKKVQTTFTYTFLSSFIGALIIALISNFMWQARAMRLIREDEKERQMADEIASQDRLTGLYSNSLTDQLVGHGIETADRHEHFLAVMFFDLASFSDVNESYGYEEGNAVLKEVALRLKNTVRKSDVVIRQGADKFIIILNDVSEVTDSAAVAKNILEETQKIYHINDHQIELSACIGIAVYPADGATPSLLLRRAESALHNTKKTKGKSDYSFYQSQMSRDFAVRKELEADMKSGLENGDFRLFYQPQYSVDQKAINGCEALIRWFHPTRGMVSPADFIPAAERSGFIVDLGEWIIKEACVQARFWQQELKNSVPIQVAVNLSAVQFSRSDLVSIVKKALDETGLPPELLELEITESMMMDDQSHTIKVLDELKKMGLRVAIDDFGTGYSSLAYLKKFDADILKVDQGFVRDMHNDEDDRVIVSAVVNMAKNLDYHVVAEGVENQEQFDLLRNFGCHIIQGYFFSKPLPAKDFFEFVKKFAYNPIEKEEILVGV